VPVFSVEVEEELLARMMSGEADVPLGVCSVETDCTEVWMPFRRLWNEQNTDDIVVSEPDPRKNRFLRVWFRD